MSCKSPQNPLEKGGMDLSSKKKTGLPIGKDRKKRDVAESSIVPSLQYPKGIHGK